MGMAQPEPQILSPKNILLATRTIVTRQSQSSRLTIVNSFTLLAARLNWSIADFAQSFEAGPAKSDT